MPFQYDNHQICVLRLWLGNCGHSIRLLFQVFSASVLECSVYDTRNKRYGMRQIYSPNIGRSTPREERTANGKVSGRSAHALSTSLSVVAEAWKVPGYELY